MKNRVSSFLIKLNLFFVLFTVAGTSVLTILGFRGWFSIWIYLLLNFLLIKLRDYLTELLESNVLADINGSQNCDEFAEALMSPFNLKCRRDVGVVLCGNYREIINYYSKKYKGHVKETRKIYYLSNLAVTYFQIDDIENASKICDIIESMNPSELYMKTVENIRLYRDGRYSEFVERSLKELSQYKKGKINYAFKLLCVGKGYYKMSDMEKAKECFEEVLTLMPKAGCSELARRYLEDINNETEHNLQFERLTPDPDYKLPKSQTWYLLGMHLLCFILSFLICACVLL